ncbi:MAG: hypothetical protein JNJ45_05635 [Chthonomonas sp.]|nr:hypothetical protein [Chthonomonas sp.]
MSTKLSSIEGRVTRKITHRDITFEISYLPEAIKVKHLELFREMSKMKGDEDRQQELAEKNADLLLAYGLQWDFVNDSDQPIAVTRESILERSIALQGVILTEIMRDQVPNQPTPPSSGDTSAPVAGAADNPSTTQ